MTVTVDRPTGDRRDNAGGDERVHLREKRRNVAVCGAKARPHGCADIAFEEGMSACPSCGRPACLACLQIMRAYDRTGGWEGP